MRLTHTHAIAFLAGLTLLATGCQHQVGQIFRQRGELVLASDFGAAPPARRPASAPATTRPATRPTSQPATQPGRRRYTSPAPGVQQLSFLAVLVASVGAGDGTDAGRAASESSISTGGGVVGRAGLAAPQPIARQVVVSRPGLSRGFATGLGFAGANTVFTAQRNALSGATGACQDLAGAGFFGGNATACEASFAR